MVLGIILIIIGIIGAVITAIMGIRFMKANDILFKSDYIELKGEKVSKVRTNLNGSGQVRKRKKRKKKKVAKTVEKIKEIENKDSTKLLEVEENSTQLLTLDTDDIELLEIISENKDLLEVASENRELVEIKDGEDTQVLI